MDLEGFDVETFMEMVNAAGLRCLRSYNIGFRAVQPSFSLSAVRTIGSNRTLYKHYTGLWMPYHIL